MTSTTRRLVAALLSTICLQASAADDRFADVVVDATHVAGGVHMLTGAGGNIALLVTDDGALMVDDQYAPLAERIDAVVSELAGARPRFVLNTHYHGDHTGSNVYFGDRSTIVAHENVRTRLVDGETPAQGLPVVTYGDRLRLHVGGETVDAVHLPAGHTDGDSLVWFREANVVHLGDEFFNGGFPYVDLAAGGTVAGVTDNMVDVLARIDADTRIIPGHGPLATAADLRRYVTMLRETTALISAAIDDGASDDEIRAAGLPERYAPWGQGFINSERWIDTLLTELRGSAR